MNRSRLLLLITAFLLVLAFVWGSTGSSCLESVHQWHRREQQVRLKGKCRDTLVMSYTEYLALTAFDAKEIRYNGRMYDIAGGLRTGDLMRLYGHYDDLDQELFRMIDSFLGGEKDASQDVRRSAIFLFNGIIPEPVPGCSGINARARAAYGVSCIPVLLWEVRDVLIGPPERMIFC